MNGRSISITVRYAGSISDMFFDMSPLISYISDSTGKIRTIHTDDPVPEYDVLISGLDDAFGTGKE